MVDCQEGVMSDMFSYDDSLVTVEHQIRITSQILHFTTVMNTSLLSHHYLVQSSGGILRVGGRWY